MRCRFQPCQRGSIAPFYIRALMIYARVYAFRTRPLTSTQLHTNFGRTTWPEMHAIVIPDRITGAGVKFSLGNTNDNIARTNSRLNRTVPISSTRLEIPSGVSRAWSRLPQASVALRPWRLVHPYQYWMVHREFELQSTRFKPVVPHNHYISMVQLTVRQRWTVE